MAQIVSPTPSYGNHILGRDEVYQGAVLWLPPKHEIQAYTNQSRNTVRVLCGWDLFIDKDIFKHPILVISRPMSSSRKIHFLSMTTFHGHTLTERFPKPKDDHIKERYLPVEPQVAHPRWARKTKPERLYQTLRLKYGIKMDRRGYVYAGTVYTMDCAEAARYYGDHPDAYRPFVLDESSLTRVLDLVLAKTKYAPQRQYHFSRAEQWACVCRISRFWAVSKWLRWLLRGLAYIVAGILVILWFVVLAGDMAQKYTQMALRATRVCLVGSLVALNEWCEMGWK